MNLIEELKGYGYEAEEIDENTLGLFRSQYMDDGYGYYFDADIYLTYDKTKDEIIEITIDGHSESDIDTLLNHEISKCPSMQKHNCCVEELDMKDLERIEDKLDCGDCKYLTMISTLFMYINDGNW